MRLFKFATATAHLVALAIVVSVCLAGPASDAQTTGPSSRPIDDAAPAGTVAEAEKNLVDARAAIDMARDQCVKKLEVSKDYQQLAADAATKDTALQEARSHGTPQERIDASSAANKARRQMIEVKERALRTDTGIAKAKAAETVAAATVSELKERDRAAAAKATAEAAARDAAAVREARAKADADQEPAEGENPKEVPPGGDETTLALVKADPKKYVGKEFIVRGGIKTANYYNYGFEGTQDFYYSIRFGEVGDGLRINDTIHGYLPKKLGQEFMETTAARNGKGHWKFVQLKVTLTAECFSNDEWHEQVKILDWQFLNQKRTGWTPWLSR
ncbi:MAG TPA: hypothetical protein VIL86_14275 [Tepidisphaeraceae bacterium]|jgi:hypothetical protein